MYRSLAAPVLALALLAACAEEPSTAPLADAGAPSQPRGEPASPTSTVGVPTSLPRGRPGVFPVGSGSYAFDADEVGGGPSFVFEIPGPGWDSWAGGVVQGDPAVVGMSFGEIWNVHVDPCRNSLGLLSPPPGPSVDDLVAALVAMPGFLVTGAPEPVVVDGYQGMHLELTVDPALDFATCDEGFFDSWVGPLVQRYHQAPGQVEELWVLDVEGERVAFGAMRLADAPADIVEQLDQVLASVGVEVADG